MEITIEQRKQLLEYLSRRPYAEVFQMVAMLVALKPKEVKTNGDHIVLGFHGHHHIAESNSLIGNKQK